MQCLRVVLYINSLMKNQFGAEMLNAPPPLFAFCNETIHKKKDHRIRVSAQQISDSPYNNIGWIQSKQKSSSDSSSTGTLKGTGFLISPSLVLTSSHNFVVQDDDLGEVTEFQPISFSTLQPGVDGLVQKVHKIKRTKINSQFLRLSKAITVAKKNMYYKERDVTIRTQYVQKILSLEKQLIQHDFALLQLEQPIERPQYFELHTSWPQKCVLSVTGYVHHYGTQYQLFTYSDKFSQIVKGAIYYDIETKVGQSGSPAYLEKEGEQAVQVVGIHKAYDPQKRLNFATMLTDSVIAVLKEWASQMDDSFGKMSQNSNPIQFINNCIDDLREKGDELREQAQFEGALSYYRRALEIAQKLKSRESVEYAKTLGSIGSVYRLTEQYEESLQCFTNQLQIYESIFEKQSFEKANAFTNISIVQIRLDKDEKAKENYRSAVEIYNKIGTESIKCPYKLQNIGRMHYQQNEKTKALEYYQRALAIYEKIGKESIGWAQTLYNIGPVYKNQNRVKQAIEYYLKAVEIYENIGKESIGWADTLFCIAFEYGNQGKVKQQLEYYLKEEAIHKKIGKKSIDWADNLQNIGYVYHKQGLYEKKQQFLKRAQEMKDSLK